MTYPQDEQEFKNSYPEHVPAYIAAEYWIEWNERYGCPQGQPARRVMLCLRDLWRMARGLMELDKVRMVQIRDLENALRNANLELKRVRNQRDAERAIRAAGESELRKALYEGEG